MNREKLIEAGIDYDEGVKRFAGKAAIFEKYLVRLFEVQLMENLKEQLEKEDYKTAFRTAHDLKGSAGNLSVNIFQKKICELVETLRGEGPYTEANTQFAEAKKLYEIAEKAVKEQINEADVIQK